MGHVYWAHFRASDKGGGGCGQAMVAERAEREAREARQRSEIDKLLKETQLKQVFPTASNHPC
jgi:hypothetical protein